MLKTIKLDLPQNYVKSKVLVNSSPSDTELILVYGEKLLESHKTLVTANITDKRYKQIEKKLAKEKQSNEILTEDIEKCNQKNEQALFGLQQRKNEEMKRQLADAHDNHSLELSEMTSNHNRRIVRIQTAAENDVDTVNQEIKEIKKEHGQELVSIRQKIIIEINEKHKTDINNHKKEKQVVIAHHNEMISDLKQQLIKEEEYSNELKENAKVMQTKHDQAINITKEDMKTQQDRLLTVLEQQLIKKEEDSDELKEIILQLQQENKKEDRKMQREYEQKKESMKQKISEDINKDHEVEINEFEKEKQDLKQSIKIMKAKHVQSLNSTKQEAKVLHDEMVNSLKMQLKNKNEYSNELKENAKVMQEKHEETINSTKEEMKTHYDETVRPKEDE